MDNQVAQRNSGHVSTNLHSWGRSKVSSSLIVPSRLKKGEPMSQDVIDGKMKVGDFMNSSTNEILGSLTNPIELVPFATVDLFRVYNMVEIKGKIKREFKEMVNVTPENEGQPYKSKDGKTEQDRVLDVYTLSSKEIASLPPDWREKGLKPLPIIVSFFRSSFRAGKQLYTQMYVINESKGLPPCATVIKLGGKTLDGDDGTYGIFDVVPSRMANQDEMDLAFFWFKAMNAGKLKPEEEVVPPPVSDVGDFNFGANVKDF